MIGPVGLGSKQLVEVKLQQATLAERTAVTSATPVQLKDHLDPFGSFQDLK